MDEVVHVEVLGRHGEVVARFAATRFPVRIGRAYDNDVIVDDPLVAPHHAVVERTADGGLELADAGSRNGVFRAGASARVARERVDGDARYRIGRTELRIRAAGHPVPAELADDRGERWSSPVVAVVALLVAAAAVLVNEWSDTFERTETAKLVMPAVLAVIAILVWSGGWGLAGRLLNGERRFAAHLAVAAVMLIGVLVVAVVGDYLAYAVSAPGLRHWLVPAVGAVLAWGIWRHLYLVARVPGRRVAMAAVAVAAVLVGAAALVRYVNVVDDLAQLEFLKVVKAPVARVAEGREVAEFFGAAARLRGELEGLKGK